MISQPKADNKTARQSRQQKNRQKITRPTLDPTRIYTRDEAALALGVSKITLIRARDAGHLAELRAGRRCLHAGQQLLDWLNSGGRTK